MIFVPLEVGVSCQLLFCSVELAPPVAADSNGPVML